MTLPPNPPQVPAGWYPNPDGTEGTLRYHDGINWTGATKDAHQVTAPRRRSRKSKMVVALLAFVFLVAGAGVTTWLLTADDEDEEESVSAEQAASDCDGSGDRNYPDVVLDGSTIIVTSPINPGDDLKSSIYTVTAVACVVSKLGGPSVIADRVGATSAVQGLQTTSWDGYTASWSYSPSSGVIFSVEEE